MSGTFKVRPITCKLDFDPEKLRHMDTFFKVVVGYSAETSHTGTSTEEGVSWQEEFEFQKNQDRTIHVEIWDKQLSSAPILLATGEIPMSTVSSGTENFSDWITLKNPMGEKVGMALVEVIYAKEDENINDNPEGISKRLPHESSIRPGEKLHRLLEKSDMVTGFPPHSKYFAGYY